MLGIALLTARNPLQLAQDGNLLSRILSTTLIIGLIMFAILMAQQKRMRAQALAAQQREQIATNQTLLFEAQLRTLQAQIEPHFLFNTLANCLSLMQTQPALAQHMLEQLIDFLRASLAASRSQQATVGSEFDLMRTYLELMQLRMGQRLRYQIQVDANIRHLPLLPMLLQPLLENAITHGIEPKLEGGHIIVTAKTGQDYLLITIEDDGVGIHPDTPATASSRSGSGMGNQNVRQRINSAYGHAARIQWLERPKQDGGGVCVELRLPLKFAPK